MLREPYGSIREDARMQDSPPPGRPHGEERQPAPSSSDEEGSAERRALICRNLIGAKTKPPTKYTGPRNRPRAR